MIKGAWTSKVHVVHYNAACIGLLPK